MPLVMNGVIIPENVANALYFNGVNITDVFMNGVQVWHQSLFSATWSGSSLSITSQYAVGLETSGSQYRQRGGLSGQGAWQSVNMSGIFSGGSFDTYPRGWDTSGNLFRSRERGSYGAWATFTIGTGFTGGGAKGLMGFYTSGGLCRSFFNSNYGPYISLR